MSNGSVLSQAAVTLMKILLLILMTANTGVLWGTEVSTAAVSPRLAGIIRDFPEIGFVLDGKSRSVACVEPRRQLNPCQLQSLETFAARLRPGKTRLDQVLALAKLLGKAPESPRFLAEYSTSTPQGLPALNMRGFSRLGKELLAASSCDKQPVAMDVSAARLKAGAAALPPPADLQSAVKNPDAFFSGKGANTAAFAGPGASRQETAVSRSAVGSGGTVKEAGGKPAAIRALPALTAGKKLTVPPPLPSLPPIQMPTGYESDKFLKNLVNVRAARAYWAQRNTPVVSAVMGAFAGMIQFAQDDAAAMGYYGITSKQGVKAAADFSFNAFSMLMTVPSVSRGVTQGIASVAAKTATGTTKVLGEYKLVARFHAIPGLPYTNAEPIWIGIEKVAQGSSHAEGIVHLGVSMSQGGAHIGLNFLGETHIYMSHVYIKALNIEVPSILIKFAAQGLSQDKQPKNSGPLPDKQ